MAQEMLKLRMKHHLSLNAVAEICGIDVLYVARMELGVFAHESGAHPYI